MAFLWGRAHGPCRGCDTESAGGQGRPPLRKHYKGCNGRATARVAPTEGLPIGFRRGRCPHRPASVTRGAVRGRNPPVTALPCPFRQGGLGTGRRIATGAVRPRNDRSRKNSRVIPRPVRKLVVGSELSAASGGCSEAISRKCPDWRPQQWPGIGWHDGGQENPAPTETRGAV